MNIKFERLVLYVLLVIIAIISILPFYLMIVNSTRNGQEIMRGFSFIPGSSLLENYAIVKRYFSLSIGFRNSLFISISCTVLSIYFSSMAAFGLAFYKFKGKNIVFAITMAVMLIPSQASLLGIYRLSQTLKMIDTYWPLILPSISSPFVIFFLRQYMISTINYQVIEASLMDGASDLSIFHRIVLPMTQPAIATMSIFAFIGSWNNYLLPLIILLDPKKFTLPMLSGYLRSSVDISRNLGAQYVVIAISLVPMMIAFIFFSRFIISSISAGAVKE